MKLRIKGNSIRYRLTKTDIDSFDAEGYVEERTHIGMSTFIYALQKSDESTLTAELDSNRLILWMPAAMAEEWINTERVGFDARIPLHDAEGDLYLLLEKDFKCLDETIEDQSDNYDNPLLSGK
ncbi:MAG: hypothetical protein EOP51_09255 [Sphingobacteriales bacterium]|nr:MAG: hypothetical protein EOP51_09255 [Sphingobacteriales bacterium]